MTNESTKYFHILNLRILVLFFFLKLFLCIHSFSSVISSQILLIFPSPFVLLPFFLFFRKKRSRQKRKVKLKKKKKNHDIHTPTKNWKPYYISKRLLLLKQANNQKTDYQKQYETKIFKNTIVFLLLLSNTGHGFLAIRAVSIPGCLF